MITMRTRDMLKTMGTKKNDNGKLKLVFEYEDIDVIRDCLAFVKALHDNGAIGRFKGDLPNLNQIKIVGEIISNAIANK